MSQNDGPESAKPSELSRSCQWIAALGIGGDATGRGSCTSRKQASESAASEQEVRLLVQMQAHWGRRLTQVFDQGDAGCCGIEGGIDGSRSESWPYDTSELALECPRLRTWEAQVQLLQLATLSTAQGHQQALARVPRGFRLERSHGQRARRRREHHRRRSKVAQRSSSLRSCSS
jgi:hypothetical protein